MDYVFGTNIKHHLLACVLKHFVKVKPPILLLMIHEPLIGLLGYVDCDVTSVLIDLDVLVGEIHRRPRPYYNLNRSLYHLIKLLYDDLILLNQSNNVSGTCYRLVALATRWGGCLGATFVD